MPVEFPTSEKPQAPPDYFWQPKTDEVAAGWARTITWYVDWPLIIHRHGFMPMAGQAPLKNQQGQTFQRNKQQRAVCLGSPTKRFDGTFELELSHDGCEVCRSIKLPDGSCLHDQPSETDNWGNEIDWRYIFPIYCWEDNMPYIVNEADWANWLKVFLAERQMHEESPKTYAVRIEGRIVDRKREFHTQAIPLPSPLPQVDPTDERWGRIRSLSNPIPTPQEIVQRLGIGKYNLNYDPSAAPVSGDQYFGGDGAAAPVAHPTGPIGDDEDPFGEPEPAATGSGEMDEF